MSNRYPFSAIVAVGTDGSIGDGLKMPWHLPDDFKWFKEKTTGHAVVMGRRTYESIGKPLPHRTNIVLSRNPHWSASGVRVVASLEQALGLVQESGDSEPFIIGGAELFSLAHPLIGRYYWTEVQKEFGSPLKFPSFDRTGWRELYRRQQPADERHIAPLAFTILERR